MAELETFLNKSAYKKSFKSALEGLANKPTTSNMTSSTSATATTNTTTNDITILLYSQIDDKFDTITIASTMTLKIIL